MQATWSGSTIVTSPVGVDSEILSESLLDEQEEDWEARFEDLVSIRTLHNDWDGMGAEAPLQELVDSALELFRLLRLPQSDTPPPSRIVASPLGTVVFEWHLDTSYLEVEIPQPDFFQWMFETPGKQTLHWESKEEINQDVTTISSPSAGYSPSEFSYGT